MDKIDFQSFIDSYSSDDFEKIKFDWNGKHANDLKDNNITFRTELIDFIIPQVGTVNIELVKDLYIESAKFSKEGWGVTKYFNILGQELILRDYKKYLLSYLEGASYSMDTHMDSCRIKIPKDLAEEIHNYIIQLSKNEKDERTLSLLNTIGLKRFEWLAQK